MKSVRACRILTTLPCMVSTLSRRLVGQVHEEDIYACGMTFQQVSSGLTEVTNVDVRADRGVVGMDRYYRTLVHIAV